MKQMMLSKHFNLSLADTDALTPFDLDFYYNKMGEYFEEQKKKMNQN